LKNGKANGYSIRKEGCMEVTVKLEGIKQLQDRYSPAQIKKAVNAAMRRAIRSGKTAASDEIRNKLGFNIMKSDLDRKIRITTRPMEGEISVAGKPIIMSYFKPVDLAQGRRIIKKRGAGATAFHIKQARRGGAGVRVEIIRGKPTILRGGRWRLGIEVEGAFIGTGRGGTPLVFGRVKGSRRLIAYKVYSEHFMFKKTINRVASRVLEQWKKEWANQVKQLESGTATWLDV